VFLFYNAACEHNEKIKIQDTSVNTVQAFPSVHPIYLIKMVQFLRFLTVNFSAQKMKSDQQLLLMHLKGHFHDKSVLNRPS
jgi:hypothetical protein